MPTITTSGATSKDVRIVDRVTLNPSPRVTPARACRATLERCKLSRFGRSPQGHRAVIVARERRTSTGVMRATELATLSEGPAMPPRHSIIYDVIFFIALLATALALGAALAHALELPNKINLAKDEYFVVQQVYRSWNQLGYLLAVELIAMLIVAALS